MRLRGACVILLAVTIPASSLAASEDDDELFPVGVVWRELTLADEPASPGSRIALTRANGQWWVLAGRANASRVLRSADGETFTEALLAPPPDSGRLTAEWLLERADGGLLAYGERGTDCDEDQRDADGFRRVAACRRLRPVLYQSDDGGDTWRLSEPDGLAPPSSDVNLRLVDVFHDGAQYVAAGTVLGSDWHVRLYTSPDNERWTLLRELRDPRGPLHAVRLLFDGTTYVLHTHASPCSEPIDGGPGWRRGSNWPEHDVFYVGADLDGLTVLDPAAASIVPAPMDVDCSVTDGFALSREPYPSVRSDLAAGWITLIDASAEAAGGDPTLHRLAVLTDGAWREFGIDRGVDADGEPLETSVHPPLLTEVDGRLAVVELLRDPLWRDGAVLPQLYVQSDWQVDGDSWDVVTGVAPVIMSQFTEVVWHGGGLVASGSVRAIDDSGSLFGELPGVWRSTATSDDPRACELVAGAQCRGAVLTTDGGDLDVSGRDLSGIDLSYAQLEAGVFDRAVLRDANLYQARMLFGGSLAGADLAGADLRGSWLYGLVDVDLDDADARNANLNFVGPPQTWEGVVLDGANLRFGFGGWVDGPREVSLAGLDLTGVTVSGVGPEDVPRMRIIDLTGATLDGTAFRSVDLTGLDIAPDALAAASFNDQSTCPDGLPPTGERSFSLTCIRD